MMWLARPRAAAALSGLYLALYAWVGDSHQVEFTDLPAFAQTFAVETAGLVLWCLGWSAASWLHARRDDFCLHLSMGTLGALVCLLLLYVALPSAYHLLDLPWQMAFYDVARLAGIMLFGLWQWRIVIGRRPPLRLWALIGLTLMGLQCVHSWSQLHVADSLARLPFEANIALPLNSPLPVPDLDQGVNRLWSPGWE
jgi:hypothetical protein